jgi:Flp pilus assembly protein TadG
MSTIRAFTDARRHRHFDEDGQFLVMAVIFMTMFLALAGLVVDGGSYLNANEAAATEAAQAARAGAAALNPSQLHAATLEIEIPQAVATAENAMTAAGQPGTAWVIGSTVYAHISYDQPTQLLSIIGVTNMHIDVTEQATNVAGVS